MPRPSLVETRTKELLHAFMRCVARYGLDGSTQDRIAEEAGVARPMLRHYLGNRDEMVEALLGFVMERFAEKTEALFAHLPEADNARLPVLLDSLFGGDAHQADNAPVYQALVAVSHRYDGMRDAMMGFVTGFEAAIAEELVRAFPKASHAQCEVVAAGVTAVYFNHDAAMPLAPSKDWRARQREAAELLVRSLG